jgi:glycosyltransferase involved in cell wall biosynthesis
MSERILYISYDGMLEPLGQSQVLAYLEKLAPGRLIHLISFEKPDDWQDILHRDSIRRRTKDAGIVWHPLRYHKRPTAAATAYDIAQGGVLAVALTLKHRFEIVHARSYVAGVMALAAKRLGAKLLFDMRGFWADERVDGKLWPAGGHLHRAAKQVERRLLLAADHVVTLTHASEVEIARFPYLQGQTPPITVIPTCADLDRFNIRGPHQQNPFVLGHVGTVGTWYLLDEMLRCFVALRRELPGSKLLIANRGEHEVIRSGCAEHGIKPGELELLNVPHAQVPQVIERMTAGMAIIKPAYSKIASAPTKLAEYLGCGVPCLGNAGVGDVAEILEERRVGVAMPGFTDKRIKSSVSRLISLAREPDVQQRCRTAALDLFSLPHGIAAYRRVYRELAST